MDEIWGNAAGAFIGVIGAIVVFFISERWKARREVGEIKKICLKEIDYNKAMLEACKTKIARLKDELSVDKPNLFFDFESTSILTQYLSLAYQKGLLYEVLEPQELSDLNANLFGFFQNATFRVEQYVNDAIKDYEAEKNGSEKMTKDKLYDTFRFVLDKADATLNTLGNVEAKLN